MQQDDDSDVGRLSRSARRRITVYALLLLVVLASLASMVSSSQAGAGRALDQRFAARTEMAADFLDSYGRDLLGREASLAATRLAGPTPSDDALVEFSAAFGFEAALLLEADGRVLQVLPSQPALIGRDLTGTYEHLRTALNGVPTASRLVSSAARAEPVVAFATPFATPSGERRVVSGAFDVARTPIADYLAHAMPVSGFKAFLLDDKGNVLAGNDTTTDDRAEGTKLAVNEAPLAAAMGTAGSGTYKAGGQRLFFVVRRVGVSPWRLVMTVPTRRLHAPLGGLLSRSPWLLLAFSAVAGVVKLGLVRRLYLHADELEHLSQVDALTGLANRHRVDALVRPVDAAARRFGSSTAVLIVDVDHFKAVNDLFGHDVGDDVLRVTAARIRACVRPQDIVGRWGGEEFVVVLAAHDVEQAAAAAERIRATVGAPMAVGDHSLTVTVSIGCAVGAAVVPLLRDADHALYDAKRAGRNRVVVDLPPVPCTSAYV